MFFAQSKIETEYKLTIGGEPTQQNLNCPNCNIVLTKIASVNGAILGAFREELIERHLELFYCWRCNLKLAPFSYDVSKSEYGILNFQEGKSDGYVYEPYPLSFDEISVFMRIVDAQELETLHSEICEYESNGGIVTVLNHVDFMEHDLEFTVGPWHYGNGGLKYLKCQKCLNTTDINVTIPGTVDDVIDFTGPSSVIMVFGYCKVCSVITADHFIF